MPPTTSFTSPDNEAADQLDRIRADIVYPTNTTGETFNTRHILLPGW